ncbi:MAG TPA: pyrimidine 5'-nucleotidase [Burkholderiaceae bacterium]|nr:pyrimidine 5'-nucleotidase [Burkholderiaceae bacterium]
MRRSGQRVWFFDLDDTLHEASPAVFAAIDTRMTDFVQRHLELTREQADQLRRDYWRRYGATMLGLIRHHGVDPHQFLRETHDFRIEELMRIERGLARVLARLPGRKVLLSNAPGAYAGQVLRRLGLHRHIRARYPIERLRLHGHFRPKPSIAMLRAVLAREGLAGRANAGRAVLVDDSAINLKSARAAGFSTVLRIAPGARRARDGGAYVDARVRTVRQLLRRLG